jgi:hypothetical protein
MRTIVLVPVAVIAAVVGSTIPATGSAETVQQPAASAVAPTDSCLTRYTQVAQLRYIRAVYHRPSVSKRARRKIRRMASCSYSEEAAQNMSRLRARQGRARKERARAERCTPYGAWAIPPYIVMRESRGRNVPNSSGSTASGPYQMLDSTFHDFGGPDLKGIYDAMHSPRSVQDCVAERVWADGSHHWALTR